MPAAPEDGGPRNCKVTGVSSALNLHEQCPRRLMQMNPGKAARNFREGRVAGCRQMGALQRRDFGKRNFKWIAQDNE